MPLAVLLGHFLKGFGGKAGQLAAEDAYRGLKRLLAEASASRPTPPGQIATVQVEDPDRHWTIHLPGDLSDEGYRQLFAADTSEWGIGDHIYYDAPSNRWTFYPRGRPKDRRPLA